MNDASWGVITLAVPSFRASLFFMMLLMFYFTI